jgi:hypothetical protein
MFRYVVLYKISNLLIVAKIQEMIRHYSKTVKTATNLEELYQILEGKSEALVVCDLTVVKDEISEVNKIATLRGAEVLGYYPHVDKQAESLGHSSSIKFVVPRSAMQSKIIQLMK